MAIPAIFTRAPDPSMHLVDRSHPHDAYSTTSTGCAKNKYRLRPFKNLFMGPGRFTPAIITAAVIKLLPQTTARRPQHWCLVRPTRALTSTRDARQNAALSTLRVHVDGSASNVDRTTPRCSDRGRQHLPMSIELPQWPQAADAGSRGARRGLLSRRNIMRFMVPPRRRRPYGLREICRTPKPEGASYQPPAKASFGVPEEKAVEA